MNDEIYHLDDLPLSKWAAAYLWSVCARPHRVDGGKNKERT